MKAMRHAHLRRGTTQIALLGLAAAFARPAAGQLALPYAGTATSANPAFSATNWGTGDGIDGISAGRYGVYGTYTGTGHWGYLGSRYYGAYGQHSGTGNWGYLGSESTGVSGLSSTYYGVRGVHSTGPSGYLGSSSFGAEGVYSNGNYGMLGTNLYGVYGVHSAAGNYGILGSSQYGVFGYSANGFAGYFQGNVKITGVLSKGAGSFKIDHPLDPANKYLYHSFVESPDMKNIYDGVATLDANGQAVIEMPNWFQALNRDFRYQLTCIGGFAPVYISGEMQNNRFQIAGGKSGMKVSWTVTGIRQDAFANAHRIPVEEDKPAEERGKFLHPVELGVSEKLGIGH